MIHCHSHRRTENKTMKFDIEIRQLSYLINELNDKNNNDNQIIQYMISGANTSLFMQTTNE